MWIRDEFADAVRKIAYVGFVNRSITKYWNARRSSTDEPALLTGWFWICQEREGGPFHSQTACIRDAYYHLILGTAPPPTPTSTPEIPNTDAKRARRKRRAYAFA